ncbi:type I-E CRISPR-associated protein Cse1/CasA, partial [Escherichia coli]|nr:type I-E CRISPR-associated protein Cse1/CasA [Escherichia coli]
MDLTREKWLPVVLTNGERTKISLVDLLNDSIHDVAWPRADFQGAAWEMLIGLLTVTVPPKDDEDWEEVWDEGIEPEVWEKALQKIAPVLQFGA